MLYNLAFLSDLSSQQLQKDFFSSNFPKKVASKKVTKMSQWQFNFLKEWSVMALQTNFDFINLSQTMI